MAEQVFEERGSYRAALNSPQYGDPTYETREYVSKRTFRDGQGRVSKVEYYEVVPTEITGGRTVKLARTEVYDRGELVSRSERRFERGDRPTQQIDTDFRTGQETSQDLTLVWDRPTKKFYDPDTGERISAQEAKARSVPFVEGTNYPDLGGGFKPKGYEEGRGRTLFYQEGSFSPGFASKVKGLAIGSGPEVTVKGERGAEVDAFQLVKVSPSGGFQQSFTVGARVDNGFTPQEARLFEAESYRAEKEVKAAGVSEYSALFSQAGFTKEAKGFSAEYGFAPSTSVKGGFQLPKSLRNAILSPEAERNYLATFERGRAQVKAYDLQLASMQGERVRAEYAKYGDVLGGPPSPFSQEAKLSQGRLGMQAALKFYEFQYGLKTGLRDNPGQFAASLGIGAVLGSGLGLLGLGARGAAGFVTARGVPSIFTQTVGKAANLGAKGGFAYLTGREALDISRQQYPAFEVGRRTATKYFPAAAGGVVGFKGAERAVGFARTFGKTEVAAEDVIAPEYFQGQKYPALRQGQTAGELRQEFFKPVLPEEAAGVGRGFTASPRSFEAKTAVGAGSSELPGLYQSPRLSPAFLKVSGEGVVGLNFPVVGSPTALRLTPEAVELSPLVGSRDTIRNLASAPDTRSFLEGGAARKGTSYVTFVKTEKEAVLPEGSLLEIDRRKYFFTFKGVRVPIFEGRAFGSQAAPRGRSTPNLREAYSGQRLTSYPPVNVGSVFASRVGVKGKTSPRVASSYQAPRQSSYFKVPRSSVAYSGSVSKLLSSSSRKSGSSSLASQSRAYSSLASGLSRLMSGSRSLGRSSSAASASRLSSSLSRVLGSSTARASRGSRSGGSKGSSYDYLTPPPSPTFRLPGLRLGSGGKKKDKRLRASQAGYTSSFFSFSLGRFGKMPKGFKGGKLFTDADSRPLTRGKKYRVSL